MQFKLKNSSKYECVCVLYVNVRCCCCLWWIFYYYNMYPPTPSICSLHLGIGRYTHIASQYLFVPIYICTYTCCYPPISFMFRFNAKLNLNKIVYILFQRYYVFRFGWYSITLLSGVTWSHYSDWTHFTNSLAPLLISNR